MTFFYIICCTTTQKYNIAMNSCLNNKKIIYCLKPEYKLLGSNEILEAHKEV